MFKFDFPPQTNLKRKRKSLTQLAIVFQIVKPKFILGLCMVLLDSGPFILPFCFPKYIARTLISLWFILIFLLLQFFKANLNFFFTHATLVTYAC